MKIREILKKLIHELDNANSGYGQKVGMLNFTTTRNGFTCEFNKEALILINDIAEKIHINNSDIANFIDLSNLFKITRRYVADFYTEECFIDYSNNEIAISGSLSEYIKSEAKKNFTTYTHYFPAWTLGMERIDAISLGPVTIMNREDWIDTIDFPEKTKQRKIDFYIKELDWRNNLKSKLKKEPPVTPPLDDLAESIYDAIQNCPSILKITINGYEKDFSRKLAHLSCKTALDSISLMIGNYRVFHQQILFTERTIPLKTHDRE
ncbi:hypothetical protein [Thiothrix nivea]|uniref:hypothetical protein n=1 Tax=Thiothrix nivea TaxID=1031 RepID=UPI0005924CBD|nr:hypothetical protein [Thiothrix nivea]